MAKRKINTALLRQQRDIRLTVYWVDLPVPKYPRKWEPVKVECPFCGAAIWERPDVGPDKPLPACPGCQKKWYEVRTSGRELVKGNRP